MVQRKKRIKSPAGLYTEPVHRPLLTGFDAELSPPLFNAGLWFHSRNRRGAAATLGPAARYAFNHKIEGECLGAKG